MYFSDFVFVFVFDDNALIMFERLSGVGEEDPAAVFVTLCHILLHFIITLLPTHYMSC